MDPAYRYSTSIPPFYDQISPSHSSNSSSTSLPTQVNGSTPTMSRYYHRAPLIYPQQNHERLRTPLPPRFSSSYLGPLHQHHARFLSAWDLTSKPTIYSSSRNLASSTPTPMSISKQNDRGSCILNSCVLF